MVDSLIVHNPIHQPTQKKGYKAVRINRITTILTVLEVVQPAALVEEQHSNAL